MFFGEGGNDTLSGLGGDDTFNGGKGTDVMNGGDGTGDTAVGDRDASNRLSLDGVANDGTTGEGENLPADIENLQGGSGNDTLTGNAGTNRIDGGNGHDTIDGGAGDDTLVGGDGSDDFLAGPGADAMFGDRASVSGQRVTKEFEADRVSYRARNVSVKASIGKIPGSSGDVNLDGEDANLDGLAEERDDIQADVEVVLGSSAGDGLRAGEGTFTHLSGEGGDDLLVGGAGEDDLTGGLGSDRLQGKGGDDTLNTNDGVADREVSCGDGVDNAFIDLADEQFLGGFPADCEGCGSVAAQGQSHSIRLSGRSVRADKDGVIRTKVSCPRARTDGCTGRLALETVADRPLALGAKAYDLDPAKTRS